MPETWLLEEEENTLSLPQCQSASVTDILQWLQCFADLVSRGAIQGIPSDGAGVHVMPSNDNKVY